jgi:hypothetical protein
MPFSSFFLLVYFVAPIGEPAVHFFFLWLGGFLLVIPIFVLRCFSSGIEGQMMLYRSVIRWCPDFRASNAEEKVGPLFSHWDTDTDVAKVEKHAARLAWLLLSQCRRCLHTVYIAFLLSLFSFFTRYSYTYVLYTLSLVCLCGKGSEREPTSQPHIDRSTSSGCCHPCCCHPNGEIETIYHHHHLPCYAINIFFACQANRIAKRNKRSERIGDR